MVSREGSWEAGVDGAQPRRDHARAPRPELRYRQEHYAGRAEDRAEVLSLRERAQVPAGPFRRVLMTGDTTPLEPRVAELKLHARGVAPVLVVGLSGGAGREELVHLRRGG